MDPQTVRVILETLFERWGITTLFLMLMASMIGVSVAQMRQMRRWQPETREIATLLKATVNTLGEIARKLDSQHATCTRHYEFAQKQIEGMASIGHEMKAVVESISDSDKARTAEIMQLMTVIASRHAN